MCRLNGKGNSFLNTIKGSYLKVELDKEKKEEMRKKIMYLMEVKYCQVCNIYLFIIFTSIYHTGSQLGSSSTFNSTRIMRRAMRGYVI